MVAWSTTSKRTQLQIQLFVLSGEDEVNSTSPLPCVCLCGGQGIEVRSNSLRDPCELCQYSSTRNDERQRAFPCSAKMPTPFCFPPICLPVMARQSGASAVPLSQPRPRNRLLLGVDGRCNTHCHQWHLFGNGQCPVKYASSGSCWSKKCQRGWAERTGLLWPRSDPLKCSGHRPAPSSALGTVAFT